MLVTLTAAKSEPPIQCKEDRAKGVGATVISRDGRRAITGPKDHGEWDGDSSRASWVARTQTAFGNPARWRGRADEVMSRSVPLPVPLPYFTAVYLSIYLSIYLQV